MSTWPSAGDGETKVGKRLKRKELKGRKLGLFGMIVGE